MAEITARHVAYLAALAVFESDSYSNIALDNLLTKHNLTKQDKSFCSALFYGVVSRDITLMHIIKQYSKTDIKKLTPTILTLLKLGIYQLKYMDNVPASAAVNETVNLAKQLGENSAAAFINGILRAFDRANCSYQQPKDKLTAASVEYSVPMPLISLWRKSYGAEETQRILEAVNATPPLFLRVNTGKTNTNELIQILKDEGLNATQVSSQPHCIKLLSHGGIARLNSFKQGLYHVQDLSSQRCATAVSVDEGARVLDICAAPGGKSFTMAQSVGASGMVLSCDLYPHRIELIREGAERLSLTNIDTLCQDATIFHKNIANFDIVLCDVVCSGFGIIS